MPPHSTTASSAAYSQQETQHPAPAGHSRHLWLQTFYLLADILGLAVGFAAASFATPLLHNLLFSHTPTTPGAFLSTTRLAQYAALSGGVLTWFGITHQYRMRAPFFLECKKIVHACVLALLVDGFFQFASRQQFPRTGIIATWVFACAAMILTRILLRALLRRVGLHATPTLLIGGGEVAHSIRSALAHEPAMDYAIVGEIKDLPSAFLQSGRSWAKLCAEYSAQHILIALDHKDWLAAEQPMAQLMRENIPFSLAPSLYYFPVSGMAQHYFFPHDTLLLTRIDALRQPLQCLAKRTVDVLVSSVALCLLSPLMLLMGAIIRLDGAAALYGHPRIGRNGKLFLCYKFRSMIANSDEALRTYLAAHPEARREWDDTQKLQHDPRITRIGALLRKTSLDELPQLLNVLRGDMSLVGPRPIVKAEIPKYERDIAHYYRVRPGITGLWQVSGRNDVSYAQRVALDSWYVRNWSLWHDFAILCKTIPAVFKRSGAY